MQGCQGAYLRSFLCLKSFNITRSLNLMTVFPFKLKYSTKLPLSRCFVKLKSNYFAPFYATLAQGKELRMPLKIDYAGLLKGLIIA